MQTSEAGAPPLTPIFSSANRHSHYNRQRTRFEKNLAQMSSTPSAHIPQHVKMIADMYSALTKANK